MSDRFVSGWKVSLEKLNRLVGAHALRARDVLMSKSSAHCRRRKAPKVEWPQWTVLEAKALPSIAKELAALDRERIDALPAKAFLRDRADESREDLWGGLERLRSWVDAARAPEKKEGLLWSKTGNSLLLKMDGDR